MAEKDSAKKTNTKKAKNEKEKVKTDINSAAILNVLENYSGQIKNGKIVKLTLVQIQQYLKEFFDVSIKSTDTIKENISDLQGLGNKYRNAFPMIFCDGKDEEDEKSFEKDFDEEFVCEDNSEKINSHKVKYYWMPKKNVLDSGEYKILKAKIESDVSLNSIEKASLIRKIDSISSNDYTRELGSFDQNPTVDVESLGNKNVSKKVDTIGEAIRAGIKITFYNGAYDKSKSLEKIGDVIKFSPYHITDKNGYVYVIGLKDGETSATSYRIDKLIDLKKEKSNSDNRDNYKNLHRYIESHPFMSNDEKNVEAILKLRKNITYEQDNIGDVIDAFGYTPVITEDKNENDECEGYTVKLSATEEAIYKFALLHSDVVEVKSPEGLRNRLRKMSKYSYDSYLSTYEDFYEAEIDKIKEGGLGHSIKREFHCEGVDLSKRTEYHNIPILRLCLDNNNVEDISFVRNYKDLCSFRTRKNPIVDYTPLCDIDTIQAMQIIDSKLESYDFIKNCKSLRKLTLDNNEVKDKSALYTPLHLDYLVLFDEDEIDVELFKKSNPLTEVLIGWDKLDDKKYFINPVYPINRKYTVPHNYPLNIFAEFAPSRAREIIGQNVCNEADKIISTDLEIGAKLEAIIDDFGMKESKIFRSIAKDGKTIVETAKENNMRIQDVIDVFVKCRKSFGSKQNRDFFIGTYKKYYKPLYKKPTTTSNAGNNSKREENKIAEYKLKIRRKRYD